MLNIGHTKTNMRSKEKRTHNMVYINMATERTDEIRQQWTFVLLKLNLNNVSGKAQTGVQKTKSTLNFSITRTYVSGLDKFQTGDDRTFNFNFKIYTRTILEWLASKTNRIIRTRSFHFLVVISIQMPVLRRKCLFEIQGNPQYWSFHVSFCIFSY